MNITFSFDIEKKWIFIIQWLLILIIGCEILIGITFTASESDFLQLLKWETLAIWVWTFFSCNFLGLSYYHPYRMFLIAFFIFLLGRVFLDVLRVMDFASDIFFIEGLNFGISTQFMMLSLINLFMLFLHFGIIGGSMIKEGEQVLQHWKHDPVLERVGFFLFWAFLLPAIIYWYQFISFVFEYGYRGLNSESVIISSNIFIRLSDDMLMCGYFLLLSSKTTIKKLRWPTLIYIFILLATLLTGRRIFFFTQLLTIIAYYGWRNKISKKCFFAIAIGMVILAVIVGIYRSITDFSAVNKYNFFSNFIADQGISVHSVGLTVDYINQGDLSYDIRYLVQPLENIIGTVHSGYHADQLVSHNFFLADRLSSLFDQELFISGGGLGSSIVAEFYVVAGIWGVILGGFGFGFALIMISRVLFRFNIGMVILLITLPMLLFTPRAHPLLPLVELVKPLLIISFCLIFYYVVRANSRLSLQSS